MNALASCLEQLAPHEGLNSTALEGVRIFRSSRTRPREPLYYSQGIIIVAQGAKRVYLDRQVLEYNPHQYLVMTLPVPAECETLRASPEEPLLALMIDIDMSLLQALVRLLDEHHQRPAMTEEPERCLYASQLVEPLTCALLRLCDSLQSELAAEALGEGLLREVLFCVLRGDQAGPLFALAHHNSHLARVERVLRFMHEHYQQGLEVEEMARLAHMSASSFHRNFRQITGSSPVQYMKKLRLTRARELLQDRGIRVKEVATRVGYASPAQFSREFKRYFGVPPQASSGVSPTA